ncbi:MAG: hypothetical protein QM760_15700 [Nibricoccus sp.]
MKARWILITFLLAFPFAFAFFMSEARLHEKRPARRVLVIPPPAPPAAPSTAAAPEPAPAVEAAPENSTSTVSENPAAAVPKPEPATAPASSDEKPLLVEGTVTKESNALVYESDAKLQLPNNVFLSSPTGVMVSDEQQKIFAGDMQLLTTKQTISANEAVLTLQPGGSSVITSKTLSIASNDDSTPPMEIKGDNVTLTIPAKKEPAKSPTETTATAAPPPPAPESSAAPAPTTP